MERLTIKTEHGKTTLKDCTISLRNAMDKLAHYEDLEEQVIKATGADIDSMIGEFMHYYKLKKENRLLELPCKVGSELYCVSKKNSDGRREVISTTVNNIMESFCYADAIGKGMYLTKSEAEKALAEMEK